MKAVVLAGGSGERFWPESNDRRPKQFLAMYGGASLLQRTVGRLMERFHPGDILVITSQAHVTLSRKELPMVPRGNIVGEPVKRNTAPACALASAIAGPDEALLVVPADHLIPSTEGFWRSCDRAFKAVEGTDGLVTFGVPPTRPETGFGYIEAASHIEERVRKVERFVEKPDIGRAKEYVSSGRFFWNSGMFVWRSGAFLEELSRYEPEMHSAIMGGNTYSSKELSRIYPALKAISVDHAVMERSDRVLMVEAEFEWSDLGSWTTISEIEGPSRTGVGVFIDGDRVYVRRGRDRPIAVIGLSDVIVVDAPGGLLLCSSDAAQSVRDAASHFRRKGRERDGEGV
jgi:mannose-1-phosphate guanylyltransferase